MFNVTTDVVSAVASTTANTIASASVLVGFLLAIPISFYVLRRIQGLFPKKK